MPFALLSVYNKEGITNFAKELHSLGYNLIGTSSTAKEIRKENIPIQEVSEFTGFSELIGGRVKTLHPKIFAGILARRDKKEDLEELKKNNIPLIDIVVCNLYPFSDVIKKEDTTLEIALENIDIGGVSLLRAGAKNFPHVLVVCDPLDYEEVIKRIKENSVDIEFRKKLAIKAFSYTSYYDQAITKYLSNQFSDNMEIVLKKEMDLRYGENPQQKAVYYLLPHQKLPWTKIHGKELSYNNLLDIDSAWRLILEFSNTACAIIKHNNPCGVAEGENGKEAFLKAFDGDPVSAYGGIIACNFIVDEDCANEMSKHFFEVIIAKGYTEKALNILNKKKNLRLLISNEDSNKNPWEIRSLTYGFLVQDYNDILFTEYEVKTSHKPDEKDLEELLFALKVVKHTKSNAIVVSKNKQTIGIGAGQMNRVNAVKIALEQAGEKAKSAYLASDAFFPFPDSIELAGKYGIKAIIQPAGSIRDPEVIQKAEELGIILVMIPQRHFRH
ncbi:MAG: bifunctional phosphoribosylaminoimidazolecarboxamide formyltransferase/IMP cyclohydrolase [Dictyoglomus sp. NZ13-RE01]|nr:MAG: bifunctional phosphoribosylaminoimidazolecarboxamide formyltransferase/IMP cyclohydrolase [Dictyoglomus sp. NZ13-RE01]